MKKHYTIHDRHVAPVVYTAFCAVVLLGFWMRFGEGREEPAKLKATDNRVVFCAAESGALGTAPPCLAAGFPTLRAMFAQATISQPVEVSRELSIAAASDLKFALDELARVFAASHPAIKVKPSYGSSGNFFAMIQNKAPFDLFMSADIQYPQKLAEAGLGADTNVFLYAVGRIVVWVPARSRVEVEKLGMQALLDPSIRKIAIANPRHAPYGRAAKAAMKSLKVYDQVQAKLVFGENITQAMQFVQSGAADIGILALSLADSPQMKGQGRYWEVPLDVYPKMEQGGLILKWAKDSEAARVFRGFLLSEPGRAVLKRYGFFIPKQ